MCLAQQKSIGNIFKKDCPLNTLAVLHLLSFIMVATLNKSLQLLLTIIKKAFLFYQPMEKRE
jgi:hypothetical protein